jgi:hypothetical protein
VHWFARLRQPITRDQLPLKRFSRLSAVPRGAVDLLDILDELSLPAAPAGHMLPSAALAELRAEE